MATFLLAEDDKFMSRLYERSFEVSGHKLEMAHDGEEALQKLASMDPKPSVLILDIMMPKKNGFDVLKEMKEDPSLKDIPVVVFSNLSSEEDKKRALDLGATMYLVKSDFEPKTIVEKVIALAG